MQAYLEEVLILLFIIFIPMVLWFLNKMRSQSIGLPMGSNLFMTGLGAILMIALILNYSLRWSGQWTHFITLIGIPLTTTITISGLMKRPGGETAIWGILLVVLVYVFVPTVVNEGNRSHFSDMFLTETNLSKTSVGKIIYHKPLPRPKPIVEKCAGQYAYTTNCKKVTFLQNSIYQREAKHGMCIAYNAKRVIKQTPLGGNEWAFSASKVGFTVHFHDLNAGESFDGFKCT